MDEELRPGQSRRIPCFITIQGAKENILLYDEVMQVNKSPLLMYIYSSCVARL